MTFDRWEIKDYLLTYLVSISSVRMLLFTYYEISNDHCKQEERNAVVAGTVNAVPHGLDPPHTNTVPRDHGSRDTQITWHMDSIHSPHRTRKTIINEWRKSSKFQRGLRPSNTSSPAAIDRQSRGWLYRTELSVYCYCRKVPARSVAEHLFTVVGAEQLHAHDVAAV